MTTSSGCDCSVTVKIVLSRANKISHTQVESQHPADKPSRPNVCVSRCRDEYIRPRSNCFTQPAALFNSAAAYNCLGMEAKEQEVETESFVQEMLQEELRRSTKSKNKIELQLARTKNNIRKHEQNLRKMKQRLREMLAKIREEETALVSTKAERDNLQKLLKEEDMDVT